MFKFEMFKLMLSLFKDFAYVHKTCLGVKTMIIILNMLNINKKSCRSVN